MTTGTYIVQYLSYYRNLSYNISKLLSLLLFGEIMIWLWKKCITRMFKLICDDVDLFIFTLEVIGKT